MNQLPTLAELHHDPQQAFKNDQLNLLLNQPPHASWLKQHPTVKAKNNHGQLVPAQYLPIDKVEFLLTRIFQEWRVEVKEVQALFQSIAVTVRLHYRNPLTGEWCYQDGCGASPVQTDSGKSAADLGAIKSAGVQMAVPSAESYAIKDAAEKLGALFGKDLNRRDIIMFAGAYSETQPLPMAQFGEYAKNVPDPLQQQQPNYQQQAPPPPPQPQFAPPQPQFAPPVNPSFAQFNPAAL